jgi:putative oxidoreductase
MTTLANLLRLSFLPTYTDLGLLILRVWVAVPMLVLHGWPKLASFSARSATFADPFGIGPLPSLVLVIVSEVFGSVLLVLGLFSRLAAVMGVIGMTVAFFHAHEARFTGPRSGELAFLFLGIYVVLLVAGPGRFSLDGGARRRW